MTNEQVLVDSDALVGWFVKTDAHHQRARAIFGYLKQRRLTPVVTNLVIAETATLFSRRQGQAQASRFLDFSQKLETVYITPELHHKTVQLMQAQTRPKTSFVDMANVVVMREVRIAHIFSFDRVYGKDFGLKLLETEATE